MKRNLLNHYGWKYKFKKRKAFTILECIIVIFISLILLSLSTTLVLKAYEVYIKSESLFNSRDYLDDAVITINRVLRGDRIKSIYIREDRGNTLGEIRVKYVVDDTFENITIDKVIKFNLVNDRLDLNTVSSNTGIIQTTTNVIAKDIESFKIIKKEKLFYIIMIHKSGESRIECL
ncbi:prepilin-type N-terminal cleavage/methylation domain-containing protein [Clostridium sp.]|uniref:prepilin-type N-terminal cleavage/methylation domain-containing protein n=1 Tax=Clostridium sp. TaxID=1506 RepID=UPI003F3E11C7